MDDAPPPLGIRLLRSFRERGPTRTFQSVISTLLDYWFDLRFGTDTVSWVPLEALEIPSENRGRGGRYQPTRVRHLKNFLDRLGVEEGSVFLDLGSGKGRTLLIASRYPFARVLGVEFSPELCAIARRNVATYRELVPAAAEISIVEADAAEYAIPDDTTHLYLYDPFDEVVMQRVLRNIQTSLEREPREFLLILNSPTRYRDLFARQTAFERRGTYVYGSGEFAVYAQRGGRVEADPG